MKKNMNVIQIKGFRGILMACFIVSCLFAGFVIFPSFLAMYSWNFVANNVEVLPTIGIIQGALLWGILAASYFIFRKDRLVVCMRTPQGLSEEELKSVFADIKKQAKDDTLIQAMMKARETELKKQLQTLNDIVDETIKEDEDKNNNPTT